MADYNIYIHSLGGEGNKSQTSAWKKENNAQMIPWRQMEEGDIQGSVALVDNETISTLGRYSGKVVGIFAAALAANLAAYKIFKTGVDLYTITNGDFRMSTSIGNYEATKNAIFNPIGRTLSYFSQVLRERNETQRRTMQRELLGDSEINRYTNRGV